MDLTCLATDCRVGSFLICAAICLGCSPEPETSTKHRYVPAVDLARQAVEEVLVDWQAGRAPAPIDRLSVGVHVVDKQRKQGQTLEAFEILGEAPSEAARCFAVRIKLSRPDAEEKVRFVVIGIDPLWVFRQEDFESLAQWSCGKPEDESPPPIVQRPPAGDDQQALDEHRAEAGSDSPAAASKPVQLDRESPGRLRETGDAAVSPPAQNGETKLNTRKTGPEGE